MYKRGEICRQNKSVGSHVTIDPSISSILHKRRMSIKEMKFFLIASFVLVMGLSTYGQTNVFIPDENFRYFLNTNYPSFMDTSGDSLIIEMAATLTGLFDCMNSDIADLTGIEYFTNITMLFCDNNQLTSLPDLSNISTLSSLICYNNQIQSLPDFSENSQLAFLDCGNNLLTSLPDFSSNSALYSLRCSNNLITSLPSLTANINLQILNCSNNRLAGLPSLSANIALKELSCYSNRLTSLPDFSDNINLTDLNCSGNQLSELGDLSVNTNLKVLLCIDNRLSYLPDLSTNTKLLQLGCYENRLTKLPDLSNNIALENLWCNDNQLTELPDLSNNTALWFVDCYSNRLDFSDARNLRIIDNLPNMLSFDYSPQDPFDSTYTISLFEGENLGINISGQDSASGYQWYKDYNILEGKNGTLLVIPNVTLADSGTYVCKSFGTALESPPMNFGPGISEFSSEPIHVTVSKVLNSEVPVTDNKINIYPNPNNGSFNIIIEETQMDYKRLQIINELGCLIYTEEFQQSGKIINRELNLNEYSEGIYYLLLINDEGIINRKIIIE